MPACPRCQAATPPGASACPSCGAGLLAPPALPSAAAARPKVSVRVVRAEGGPEAVVTMKSNVLTCGKQGDIALQEDPFVAQAQARLVFSKDRLVLEDIGGENGVFVRLRAEQVLVTGAELRIGRQRLLVESLPPAPPPGQAAWGSPDGDASFRLVQLLEGGGPGAAYLLKPGQTQVGREQGQVLFPNDGFVSARHAVFTAGPEELRVKDLGSSNGTFVRLTAPRLVENGDQFLVGRELLKVELYP